MAKPYSFGSVNLDVNAGSCSSLEPDPQELPPAPDQDTPFRILLLGDFSGRSIRPAPGARRRALRIDRDNYEQVLASLNTELHLASGLDLVVRELDDLRPEQLYSQLGVFRALRDLRRKLQNPATFPEAAAELRSWAPPAPLPAKPAEPAPQAPAASGASILDSMLLGLEDLPVAAPAPRAAAAVPARASTGLEAILQKVVGPHIIPNEDPNLPHLLAQVDDAVGHLLRNILHDPAFQHLEAAWRALFFLIRELETNSSLQLYLCDVSQEELSEELLSGGPLEKTSLYKLIVEESVRTPGADPWALIAGNYAFGQTMADSILLAQLGKLAAAAGAPFVAEAIPGDPPTALDAKAWNALRAAPPAHWVGLALPRFLARLPYGAGHDTVEGFDFEELGPRAAHDDFLWANPSFALAYLLGRAYTLYGWSLRPGMVADLEPLPIYVYTEDGEKLSKPCAEVLMTTDDAEAILQQGFMPLVSYKGQGKARLLRFQSIANPLRDLPGRWS